jgi:hypothetical protein
MKSFRIAAAIAALVSTGAVAADLLPLKSGIYVPATVACKGASNADMVNYWGGASGIGVAQAECTIKHLVKKGTEYTFDNACKDIQSGEPINGGSTTLIIRNPTAFEMSGTPYRYCGEKAQF